MQLASGGKNFGCKRLVKPELVNPRIENNTKERELLQLQEERNLEWQEYTIQEVVHSVVVKAIFAAVDAQYVKELVED